MATNENVQTMQLVVLAGGKATRLSPLSLSFPKGFLSIASKPALFNMVTPLIKNKRFRVDDVTFIVSNNNKDVITSFVRKTYGNVKSRFIVQENPEGPLQAFKLAAPYITKHTLLLLGDTLCDSNLDYSYDWLGYQTINDNSHSRWCLVQTDSAENVTDVIDKPDYTPRTNKVLIGLYNFTDPVLLKKCLECDYEKLRGEYQLSSMISVYCSQKPMKGLKIDSWRDTGTLKDYNETARALISGREFNNFHLDDRNVLTKTSSYDKLKDEMFWLDTVQNSELRYLIPQYLGGESKDGTASYRMEYVGASALSEYFCYYDVPAANWQYMFGRLIGFAKCMWNTPSQMSKEAVRRNARAMYVEKTEQRVAQWNRKDILQQPYIYANGEKLQGFYACWDKLKCRLAKLADDAADYASVIHGDLCFSNVLYLPMASNYKFIDPRGRFGDEQTVYGDFRYDLAKLRHSYHGLYDYVNSGLFEITEKSVDEFDYRFFSEKMVNPDLFDAIVTKLGVNINDVELIEGVLFISMLPLHCDDPAAQLMYYVIGLKCLNNQLNK